MEKGLTQIEALGSVLIGYVPKIVGAILTLIIGFWIIRILVGWLNRRLQKGNIDISLAKFLSSLFGITLKVLLLLSVAAMFGVATTSFIAIFSAVAFAVGMALQGNLGHLASGVMLMIFKPFRVGDLVDLGGHVGVVDAINAFNTTLRTPQNKLVFLANGTVTSNAITNISGQGTIAVDMTMGIGYTDDIDKAKKLIEEIASRNPLILKDPVTMVAVSELADSSVNFLVRPWCQSEHYWDVWFYMHETVKKEFDAAGIGIPYPQMDVHVHQ